MTILGESSSYFAARERLLQPPLRDKELGLREIRRAGWSLAGDPNDLSIFGMAPLLWYLCGIRIIGRTAVELTRDAHARFIGQRVAETLAPLVQIGDVIDAFAGSGNLLFHVSRALKARRIVGLDATSEVMARTRRNFQRLRWLGKLGRSEVKLAQKDWSSAADYFAGRPTLFILAPPWGDAYSEQGLDLRKTAPPVLTILQALSNEVRGGPAFALIQTDPMMIQQSVDEIVQRFVALPNVRSSDPGIANRVDYLLLEFPSASMISTVQS